MRILLLGGNSKSEDTGGLLLYQYNYMQGHGAVVHSGDR